MEAKPATSSTAHLNRTHKDEKFDAPTGIGGEEDATTVDETMEVVPLDELSEDQPASEARMQERAPKEPPALKKKINQKMVLCVIAALALAFFTGALVGSRDSLVRWYYSKKLEQKGIQFSEQKFLAEVSKNNEESLDLFLKGGMNVGARNENGQTALMIASENGSGAMVKQLAMQDAALLNQVDKSGNTALMTAARLGKEDVIGALLESGVDVNFTVPSNEGAATALQAVLSVSDFREEHLRIVQRLLRHGANAKGRNKSGQFPLLFAAEHGRVEAAKSLIEHGADVHETDVTGRFALLAAACKGYSWFISLLVDKGANMNMALPDGHTALMCAAREGYGDTVRTFLERGADVNARAANGSTALSDATRVGNLEVVKLLLAQGADPDSGHLPGAFVGLNGNPCFIKTKKITINELLKRIDKIAAKDGYTIHNAPNSAQKMNVTAKGPWNKVLNDLMAKNHLLLVVKGQEIFVLPYDPTAVKREKQ